MIGGPALALGWIFYVLLVILMISGIVALWKYIGR